MASGEFVEEFLIQGVALVTATGRHEDVSANILVDNLAVSVHTAKSNVYVSIELNGHLEKADSEYQISMASDINKYLTLFSFYYLTLLMAHGTEWNDRQLVVILSICSVCIFTL